MPTRSLKDFWLQNFMPGICPAYLLPFGTCCCVGFVALGLPGGSKLWYMHPTTAYSPTPFQVIGVATPACVTHYTVLRGHSWAFPGHMPISRVLRCPGPAREDQTMVDAPHPCLCTTTLAGDKDPPPQLVCLTLRIGVGHMPGKCLVL